jgi:hypothetical protein
LGCLRPELKVVGLVQANFQHVLALIAFAPEVDGELKRKLIVDQQLHADCTTM